MEGDLDGDGDGDEDDGDNFIIGEFAAILSTSVAAAAMGESAAAVGGGGTYAPSLRCSARIHAATLASKGALALLAV